MVHVSLLKTRNDGKEQIWLLANEDGSVCGFNSAPEGANYYEDVYRRNHSRGFEASMSACLNFIAFEPSIVSLPMEELKELVKMPCTLHKLSHVSGFVSAIPTIKTKSLKYWKKGYHPRLID